MAIKLSDCPPSLYQAIMAQLAKEGAAFPETIVPKYAAANYICGKWILGPPTENLRLVQSLVSKRQLSSPRNAYMASIGKPLSVVVEIKQEK